MSVDSFVEAGENPQCRLTNSSMLVSVDATASPIKVYYCCYLWHVRAHQTDFPESVLGSLGIIEGECEKHMGQSCRFYDGGYHLR